jgi:D-tyrosyl-tRNA(Tyr) deacylase
MIALLQRVDTARVTVGEETVGEIGAGLLVLVCAERGDTEAQAQKLVDRTVGLRIFADEQGRMNRTLKDTAGELLVVSQFTLAADVTSGARPSFSRAAEPAVGARLYDFFIASARRAHRGRIASGRFGADMKVHLVNDGPVTIWLRVEPAAML